MKINDEKDVQSNQMVNIECLIQFDFHLLGKMFMAILMKLAWTGGGMFDNSALKKTNHYQPSLGFGGSGETHIKPKQLDKLNIFTEVTCCATHFSKNQTMAS